MDEAAITVTLVALRGCQSTNGRLYTGPRGERG